MQPQAILIGSRMAEKYDALSSIAPTLDMTIDTAKIYESSKQRLHDLGALFGKSAQAAKLQGNIDGLIDETKTLTKDKGKGLVIMVNGNKCLPTVTNHATVLSTLCLIFQWQMIKLPTRATVSQSHLNTYKNQSRLVIRR